MSLTKDEYAEYVSLSAKDKLPRAQYDRMRALEAKGEETDTPAPAVTAEEPSPETPFNDVMAALANSKPVRLAKGAIKLGKAALDTAPGRLVVKTLSPMESAVKAGKYIENFGEGMDPQDPPTSSPLAMAQSTVAGATKLLGKGVGLVSPLDVGTVGLSLGGAAASKLGGKALTAMGGKLAKAGGKLPSAVDMVKSGEAFVGPTYVPKAPPTAAELGSGLSNEIKRIADIVQSGLDNRIRPAPMQFGGLLTREEFELYSKHKGLVENTRKLGLKPGYIDTLLTNEEKLAHGKALGGLSPGPRDPIIPSSVVNDTLAKAGAREKALEVEKTLAENGIKTDASLSRRVKDVPLIPKPSWFQSRVMTPVKDFNNWAVKRGHKVLEDTGPAGVQLSKLVLEARREGAIRAGSMRSELVSVFDDLKMSESEVKSLVENLDTGRAPSNPKVADASVRIRSLMNRVFEEGQGVGLNVKFRENYFPHIHDWDEMMDKSYQSKIVAQWMKERKIENAAQGFGMLQDYLVKNATRRYGNLERSRDINLPGFERDPIKAISAYFDSAFQRIEETRRLGPNDEIANDLLVKIAEDGGDETVAGRIFSGLVKNDTQDVIGRKAMGALKNLAVFADMGLSALQNANQSVNTAAITSVNAFRKGLMDGFTKDGKKFAEMAGVVLRNAVHDTNIKAGGSGRLAERFMDVTGFNTVEDLNRAVSANAGKHYALEMFEELKKAPGSKDTIHKLERMGIDATTALKRGALTVHDLKNAAYEVARRSQFITAAEELPHFWRSPQGRFAMQFKSFTYMQSVFIKEELWNEVRRGNLAPIAKYAVAAALAGEVSKDVRLALTGGKEYYPRMGKTIHEKTGVDPKVANAMARTIDRIAFSGGFGMAVDVTSNVLGDSIYNDFGDLITPRSFDVPVQLIKGAKHLATGEYKKARKEIGGKVPVLGKMKWFTEGTYAGPGEDGSGRRPKRKDRKNTR